MRNRTRLTRVRLWLTALVAISLVAPFSPSAAQDSSQLYQSSGWNGSYMYGDADIEGRVGYQLEVSGPSISCGGGASPLGVEVVSGQLPPGLISYVGSQSFGRIGGTPQERGHFITRLRYNVWCGGGNYSIEQTVRFHITGSGQVIQ